VYGETDRVDVSLRIIAEHSRAMAFIIADGVSRRTRSAGTCFGASSVARSSTRICSAPAILCCPEHDRRGD